MPLFVIGPRGRVVYITVGRKVRVGSRTVRGVVHSGRRGKLGSGVVGIRRHLGSKPGAVRRAQTGVRAPGDRRDKPVDGGLPRGIDKASGGFGVSRCVTKQGRAFCIPVVTCELKRSALKTARLFGLLASRFLIVSSSWRRVSSEARSRRRKQSRDGVCSWRLILNPGVGVGERVARVGAALWCSGRPEGDCRSCHRTFD